jgi:alkylation response protein AidB-like acyl-CoA dehydrogenase
MRASSEWVERAAKLAPLLAANAARAERDRRLSSEVLDALLRAEFFSLTVPRAFGGRQAPPEVLIEVARELARHCGATGWVVALLGIHNAIFGLLSTEGQRDVFGSGAPVLAPGIFAPQGQLAVVDGGYRLSGRWGFASGCLHSNWALLAAVTDDFALDADAPEVRMAAIPIAEARIADTWHTAGMRGTGSNDLIVTDVFVPTHRTLAFGSLLEGVAEHPGSACAEYTLPLMPLLTLVAAAPALGIARCAVDAYISRARSRIHLTGARQSQRAASLMRLGESELTLNSAGSMLREHLNALTSGRDCEETSRPVARARQSAAGAYAVQQCAHVVDQLVAAAGAGAQFESSVLQRCQRDIHTLRGHVVFDFDSLSEAHGQALLGQMPSAALL